MDDFHIHKQTVNKKSRFLFITYFPSFRGGCGTGYDMSDIIWDQGDMGC